MTVRTGMGLAAALVGCIGASEGFAAASDKWPVYQGSDAHAGLADRSLLADLAHELWGVRGQPNPVSLAVDDGLVFTTPRSFGSPQALLMARHADSGQIAWTVNFGSVFSLNQRAIDNGRIYIQTSNNWNQTFIHCYSTAGQFIWRSAFNSQWETYLGPIVVDDAIYFNGGTYGGLYKFALDGKLQWFRQLPQYDAWSPTWAGGRLVTYTNVLTVVDPDDGQIVDSIPDPGYYWSGYDVDQSPIVVGDLAYVTNGGRILAYDLGQMTIAWIRPVGATGQISTDGSEVFVIAGGALSVHDALSGDPLWSWVPSASGSLNSRIIATRTHLIVGDGSQTYLVNRSTRVAERTFPGAGLMAYAEDTLFIAEANGTLSGWYLPTDELHQHGFE